MQSLLALVISGGNIGSLLLWFVGIVLICLLLWYALKTLGAPDFFYKALVIVGILLLILVVIDFFFGAGEHIVVH